MNVIVDVQGFKNDQNKFIIKEIAILSNNQMYAFLVRPPYPFYNLTSSERRQVSWIERNRKVYWSEGFVPYLNFKSSTQIANILKNKCIFTKGIEKVLWIKDICEHNKVYNLEDYDCPSITNLNEKYKSSNDVYNCIYHSSYCALKNVICIKKWCKERNLPFF